MSGSDTDDSRLRLEGVLTVAVCFVLLVIHTLQIIAENHRQTFRESVSADQHPRDGFLPRAMRRLLPIVTIMLLLRTVRVFSSAHWSIIVFELASNNATVFSAEIVLLYAWSLVKQQHVVDMACVPESIIYVIGILFFIIGDVEVVLSAVYDRQWFHAIFLIALCGFGVLAALLMWVWVARLNSFINRLKQAEIDSQRMQRAVMAVSEAEANTTSFRSRRSSRLDLERAPLEMSESRSNSKNNSVVSRSPLTGASGTAQERVMSFPAPMPFESPDYGPQDEEDANVEQLTLGPNTSAGRPGPDSHPAGSYGASMPSSWSAGVSGSGALQLRSSDPRLTRAQSSMHSKGRTVRMASLDDDPKAFPSRRQRGPLARVVNFLMVATFLTVVMTCVLYFDIKNYLSDMSAPFWSAKETRIADMSNLEDGILFGLRFAWVFFLTSYSWGPMQDAWRMSQVGGLLQSVSEESVACMITERGLDDGGSLYGDENDHQMGRGPAFHALPSGNGDSEFD